MGVTATLRSVTEEELKRARRDPSYAARLIDEAPEGDKTPLNSNLSVQRRTFFIERFSLNLWEALVRDAPVNVWPFTVDDGFAHEDYGFVDEDEFNDFRTSSGNGSRS